MGLVNVKRIVEDEVSRQRALVASLMEGGGYEALDSMDQERVDEAEAIIAVLDRILAEATSREDMELDAMYRDIEERR